LQATQLTQLGLGAIESSYFDEDLQVFEMCFMLITSSVDCPPPALEVDALEALEPLARPGLDVLPVI
jgi:hypothetical protein